MHVIEACIFKYNVNKKKFQKKNWSRNLNSVPHGPSNNISKIYCLCGIFVMKFTDAKTSMDFFG